MALPIDPSIPSAGSILQEIQPTIPQSPSSNNNGIKIDEIDINQFPDSNPFKVEKIAIQGNKSIETQTLHALIQDKEGQDLTLRQLGELASLITRYYHAHNYPLAVAVIPAQEIKDGIVVLQVLEASYGKVLLENKSKLHSVLLNSNLARLKSGELITGDQLNKTLLLLNDIPGINVNTEVKQGELSGTSDFNITTTDAKVWRASMSAANSGSASIGRMRENANLDILNPLGLGDTLNISGMTAGSGMNYGRASYELLVNGQGTRVGAAYSDLYYKLGKQYQSIDAHGTAENVSLWARHPLMRSLDFNVSAQAEVDRVVLKDHIDLINAKTDRTLNHGILTLSGDRRDHLWLGGINLFNISLTSGKLGFDNNTAQFMDRFTAKTQGSFSKINASLSRLQQLGGAFSLYGMVSGQWTNSNLDASQKMVIGGPYSVRAYDVSALSGDEGKSTTIELRKDFPSSLGFWQATAFYDAAHISINHTLWTNGINEATLQGIGLGLGWQSSNQWSAHITVAKPVGHESSLLSPASIGTRAWAEVRKDF